jgi:chromosome partitioning protein
MASLRGLGWPGDTDLEVPDQVLAVVSGTGQVEVVPPAPRRLGSLGWPLSSMADRQPQDADVDGDGVARDTGGLAEPDSGSASGDVDKDRKFSADSSGRVRRALTAAVSRETRPENGHQARGRAVQGDPQTGARVMQTRPELGEGKRVTGLGGTEYGRAGQGRTPGYSPASPPPVIVPEPAGLGGDTPIARAAEAALEARSGGRARPWPRPRACRIITIANQKGGVGKTTSAVNLAAGLALHGSRVLVIDLDPQGNASTAFDVDHHVGSASVYNVLIDDQPLAEIVQPVEGIPQLLCAPATIDLAGAEIELVPLVARESRLARAIAAYDASSLDYILIDCPPSLGLLTVNSLVAAAEVLIPIQCEYYALEGLEQLLRTVDLVRGHLNASLVVSTILLTMYDGRTRLAAQVAEDVRSHFGDVVLGSVVPRSVRVSEAPSYGQSVMTYDPGSTGALAYLEAAREIANQNVAPRPPAG